MPLSDGVPSSPPGPSASLEESLKYYKAQYESLEAELADFQASSKDLEAELEKDIEASEKRERQLQQKVGNLQYEADEWKTKYRQSKTEASNAQNTLQREITELRDTNRTLQMRLRDIEVANDDYEKKQRHTESSLEDMESKYSQAIERSVMLEEEVRVGEHERETLRIDAQRLKDELADLKIEADITKEKWRKATEQLTRPEKKLTLQPVAGLASPRSELSPTTTNASSPTFDTPPPKTASSSAPSDAPTPPSPPISDQSTHLSKPLPRAGAVLAKPRTSLAGNAAGLRPSMSLTPRPNGHARGPSLTATSKAGPPPSYRQSLSRPGNTAQRPAGLAQSSSIMQLRNLRGKMQKLEERVQNAKSKLPGPIHTPPKMSPRSGSALGGHIPSSVTVRRVKRTGGSTISGPDSLPDKQPETPSVPRHKASRPSLNPYQTLPLSPPARGDMAAPLLRPASRASGISSRSSFVPGHSRPGSRASISGFRAPLGSGLGSSFAPNASTDRVRPPSSLSNHGCDGAFDEPGIHDPVEAATPRRTTFSKRTSDVGSSIPSPTKRTSLGGSHSRLPSVGRRPSMGLGHAGEARPPSRQLHARAGYDVGETF